MKFAICGALATAASLVLFVQPALAVVSATDRNFVQMAGAAGLAEVADAQLALNKEPTESVKMVAGHMLNDHTLANQKLAALAHRLNVPVPNAPDPADRQAMDAQRPLDGTRFMSQYLRDQQAAHEQAITLFKHEIAEGSNPQLVAFAKATLPTLEKHLKMVRDAAKGM